MSKTISYLNSKAWYRFLKVVYILSFLLIFSLVNILIYTSTKPYKSFDNDKSYIQCDDGRKLGLDENDIYLTSTYVYSSDEKKIKGWCAYDPDDPININPDNPSDLQRLYPKKNNFYISAVYKTHGNWDDTIHYLIIGIVVVILIFEVIKRIFYYITLGSLKPKK